MWEASLGERLQSALGPGYRVIAELGRGGFAVVYSVRQLNHTGYLAVKVIRPDLLSSSMVVERFRREVNFVARLTHPNILSVVFSGEGRGVFYYAMPRVHGLTLRERLAREGALPVPDALNIFRQAAAGLGHAHRQAIIHRDVKPANIMIEADGRVLILDFGIAKALSAGGPSLSISGELIGSPAYMSPEQASGERVDASSDVYSLGIVGYEMLCGVPPFEGTSIQQLAVQHLTVNPPDVRVHRPEVPAPFAEALRKCLLKDPAARWSNAESAARAARL